MKDKWEIPKKHWLWLLLLFVFGVLVVICAFYLDSQVQNWIAQHQAHSVKIFMRNVSRFGDWPEHIAFGLLLMGIAYWRGSKRWIRVCAAMILACAIAGVSARVVKVVSGRARPSVKNESVWNGPNLSSRYNAFPSGHTAASVAFFGPLFFASRRLRLACLPIPLLIATSRMYVAAHYLSDIVFAVILGVLCAFLAARLLLQRSTD